MREYLITVYDPKIWDELWDTLTVDGLSDNYIPSRGVEVLNERPFNDFCAHFNLTDEEAAEIEKDPRIKAIELETTLIPFVEKVLVGSRLGTYDRNESVTTDSMKNWGLLRCINQVDPFGNSLAVTTNFTYNLDGEGIDVIIMDSGVEANHPEFAVNIDGSGGSRVVDFNWETLGVPGIVAGSSIGGYLGDSDSHGTNVASIVAGNTCGWASKAAIYSIRIFSGQDITTGATLGAINSDLAYDLVKAFHLQKISNNNTRPTIVNSSWGNTVTYTNMTNINYRGVNYAEISRNVTYGQVTTAHPYLIVSLNSSVDSCSNAGVINVGAAGNWSHKIDVPGGIDYNNYYNRNDYPGLNINYHQGMSPTCASTMINVGSSDSSNQTNTPERKGFFSETGPRVDIYAPGYMIMGAFGNKTYITPAVPDPRNTAYYLNKEAGTSQASPQVTGVLACVLQARPTMTYITAKEFLTTYSNKNALNENSAGGTAYSNQYYLQGGSNEYLYMPFNDPVRGFINSALIGTQQAIFGYGYASTYQSFTKLVSNTGVIATDTAGVGTARNTLAAAGYGGDKAIFGYGNSNVDLSITNLVSNTGVVASDTTGVGTARDNLAAAGYGGDKAIFGYGHSNVDLSITNLVSNTGVVATDTTGVGTVRRSLAAAGYGGDKAIFGYGSNLSMTNLVSNTGVVSSDTTGVGTIRWELAAAGFSLS